MVLLDVNILIYAHREDADRHRQYKQWLMDQLSGASPVGVCDAVLSGFVRIITHPKIFSVPTPLLTALKFADNFRCHPRVLVVSPGPRHWELFTGLCVQSGACGNLVADAWLAALAIEQGCDWISADRDFARFPDLRWRHPLSPEP